MTQADESSNAPLSPLHKKLIKWADTKIGAEFVGTPTYDSFFNEGEQPEPIAIGTILYRVQQYFPVVMHALLITQNKKRNLDDAHKTQLRNLDRLIGLMENGPTSKEDIEIIKTRAPVILNGISYVMELCANRLDAGLQEIASDTPDQRIERLNDISQNNPSHNPAKQFEENFKKLKSTSEDIKLLQALVTQAREKYLETVLQQTAGAKK